MKHLKCYITLILLSLIGLQTLAVAKIQSTVELDKVVAIVNKQVISKTELDKQETLVRRNLALSKTPIPAKAQLRKQVLQSLINQTLEMQMAEKTGVAISDATTDNAIRNIAKRHQQTLSQFKKDLAKKGIEYPYYHQQIKYQLTLNQLLRQEVATRIYISDEEAENIMNSVAYQQQNHSQYHLEDILMALPDEPSSKEVAAARKKAAQIMAQAKKGKNFQELAVADSSGQEAFKGGDMGWRPLEELPEVFALKVKAMKKGEVAGPIRTPNGYHIIKLIDVKGMATTHYIDETHVRHILLIKNALYSDKQIKVKLAKMRKQIQKGADFAKLAEKNSQDPVSASKGGDLGWVKPGFLTPPFEKAMKSLKPGHMSQPVETKYGWHLIEVLGRKKVDDTKTFHKNQVKQMIYERKYDEKFQNWLQQMRQASYVKIVDPSLK